MKRIPREYRRFVERKAPWFVEAVRRTQEESVSAKADGMVVETTLAAFRQDLALLYAAIWYAGSEGLAVSFHPEHRSKRE